MITQAILLRNKASLISLIPNDKPGYYKWWAKENDLDILLTQLNVDFSEKVYMEKNTSGLYCICVGIAAKESIQQRLDWHINDTHTTSRVQNGTLSTLRQSISSVIVGNQYDKNATNEFIDRLSVEWFTIDEAIKKPEAIETLHSIEKNIIAEHLYLLNIQNNKNPRSTQIKKDLKRLRKASK